MLRTPVRDSVFFVSWKGKQCADNPLGIAEELRRRGDDREHLWAVTDWSVPVPEGGTGVLRGTQEYYEALARSKYLISNDDMQAPFGKRDGQVYLQTWHGTPLKRIGFDISNPQFISGTAYFDHLAKDIAQWDLLLSPNPFSTPIMRRAFRYDGEICEYGYPRNDLLSRADTRESGRAGTGPARAAGREASRALRADLAGQPGVRERPQVPVRHAPGPGAGLAGTRPGPRVPHPRAPPHGGRRARPGCGPTSRSTSPPYPDITELFLVSDVLVTDYSSAMFDYAVTGRPMVFFTYDLAEYRDSLRGFYFDFEAEAPGPLLASSAEVIEAVRDIDSVAASLPRRLPAFRGQVLLPGRRQGRRPHLRPPLRLLIRRPARRSPAAGPGTPQTPSQVVPADVHVAGGLAEVSGAQSRAPAGSDHDQSIDGSMKRGRSRARLG